MLVRKRGSGADGIFTYHNQVHYYLSNNKDDLDYMKNDIKNNGVLSGEVGLMTGRQDPWADMPMGVNRGRDINYSSHFDDHYADHCAELDKLLETQEDGK